MRSSTFLIIKNKGFQSIKKKKKKERRGTEQWRLQGEKQEDEDYVQGEEVEEQTRIGLSFLKDG